MFILKFYIKEQINTTTMRGKRLISRLNLENLKNKIRMKMMRKLKKQLMEMIKIFTQFL